MKFTTKPKQPENETFRVARKFAFFPKNRVDYYAETNTYDTTWFWLQSIYYAEIYDTSIGRWMNNGLGGGWPFGSREEVEESYFNYTKNRDELERIIDDIKKVKTPGLYKNLKKIADLPEARVDRWMEIIRQAEADQGPLDRSFKIYIPDESGIPEQLNADWSQDLWGGFFFYYDPEALRYRPSFQLPDSL
jgi:hypothetical protein